MPIIGRPTAGKRSKYGQIVLIGAMLLTAYLLWKRGQPERLPDSVLRPWSNFSLLSHGIFYRATYRTSVFSGPRLLACPVVGGERVLADDDDRYQFGVGNLSEADGTLFYSLKGYRPPATGGAGAGG